MHVILLAGVGLNFAGAVKLLVSALRALRGAARPADHALYQLFTAGAAATFGCIYLYLYRHPDQAVPWLVFGVALKTWALVIAATLYGMGRLTFRTFAEFGVSNGLVAALFWWFLVTR